MYVSVRPKTPTLTASPPDSVVLTNTPVTLTCLTPSSGQFTYTFYKDMDLIVTSSNNSLVVTNSAADTDRHYTCKATASGVDSLPSHEHKISVVGELMNIVYFNG